MLTTTLNAILSAGPCGKRPKEEGTLTGWLKLLASLGKYRADDEPLPFSRIVESNGLEDALWCCRAAPQYDREWRLFAVWCARQVQHLMPDQRSTTAIDVAERYANGEATHDELNAARDAARDAWAAARAAAGAAQKVQFLKIVGD